MLSEIKHESYFVFCSFMLDKTEIVSWGKGTEWNGIIFQKWFSMSAL